MSQLTKQHGHELPPAGEPAGMAFALVLTYRRFKFQARKKLQICENTPRLYADEIFEAAAIPLCSGLQVCMPPGSLLPLQGFLQGS